MSAGDAVGHVIRVRWSDLDQQGHVSNVRFSGYADEALRALVVAGWMDSCELTSRDVEFVQPIALGSESVVVRPLAGRTSDLGTGGTVRPEAWADLVQEARVTRIYEDGRSRLGPMVIARCRFEFGGGPLSPDRPLVARTSIGRVGTASAVIVCDLLVDTTVVVRASSTMVGFDQVRGGSRPWTDEQRAHLLGPAT